MPKYEFSYCRQGQALGIRARKMTNHELREILVGLFLALPAADQADHLAELQHYLQPNSQHSRVARSVARAIVAGVAEAMQPDQDGQTA